MSSEGGVMDALATGLWGRLRDTILALRRLETFTFVPENPGVGTQWLRTLLDDPRLLDEVATEVGLRALRTGAEAVNFRILTRLADGEAVPLAELAESTGLARLVLSERVNDLVQVGLAGRDLEKDAAVPTAATRGFLNLVEELRQRLTQEARKQLPVLLGPDRREP